MWINGSCVQYLKSWTGWKNLFSENMDLTNGQIIPLISISQSHERTCWKCPAGLEQWTAAFSTALDMGDWQRLGEIKHRQEIFSNCLCLFKTWLNFMKAFVEKSIKKILIENWFVSAYIVEYIEWMNIFFFIK